MTATRWCRAPSALWRRTFDATLVFGHDLVRLGGASRLVWELLDAPTTANELAGALVSLPGADPSMIGGEIGDALVAMRRAGIVTDDAPLAAASAPTRPLRRRPPRIGEIVDDPNARLAAWGLGVEDLPLPPVTEVGWAALRTSIARERLTGLAYGAVTAGSLDLRETERAELAEMHERSMKVALQLEHLLVTVTDRLADAGIQAVVHKGPSIAHLAYDDPAYRPFGDIDLVVPADDLDRTFALVETLGFTRRFAAPRPGFDRRFGKGAAFVGDGGLELDVHRTFAAGPFGLTVDLDDVHHHTRSLLLGGRDIAIMSVEAQLVAVSMHAALGTRLPRLLNLRDVAQLLTMVDLDAMRAVDMATTWRVDAAVARAVERSASTFLLGDDVPMVEWARRHVAPRRQRRAMAAYVSATRGYSTQALAGLAVVPGVRAKLTYARAMLLPDASYRSLRRESRLARWTRLARSMWRRS